MGSLRWHGPQVRAQILSLTQMKIQAAAITVQNKAKQLISVAGTGKVSDSGLVVPHTGGRAKKVYGAFPSKPGEPPHKQTGRLRASVTYEMAGLVARVGTNVIYGRYLELGTRFIKPRPWLRRALMETQWRVNAILSSGGKR